MTDSGNHSTARRLASRRTALGLAAVCLCAIVLMWRVTTITREPRVAVSPRVVQLMYNRRLALRIDAYARRYGRPPYYLDSVMAHLDSADDAEFQSNLTDLWGDSVTYVWSRCGFRLVSLAGGQPPGGAWVVEEYEWPRDVRQPRNCEGDP